MTSRSDLLQDIDLLVFDKDGTLIEFHLMWGNWVEELANRLERASGLALRDRLYPLLGVDRSTGFVQAHGLLAATPMSRIRDVVQADVACHGAALPTCRTDRAAAGPAGPEQGYAAAAALNLVRILTRRS